MAKAAITIDVRGLPDVQALADRATDYEDVLRLVASHAASTRRRLRSLAFTMEEDAVLRLEEIEDLSLGVIDKWARREERA
jgi:hypothetical protein